MRARLHACFIISPTESRSELRMEYKTCLILMCNISIRVTIIPDVYEDYKGNNDCLVGLPQVRPAHSALHSRMLLTRIACTICGA